jgi:hypothetical protein
MLSMSEDEIFYFRVKSKANGAFYATKVEAPDLKTANQFVASQLAFSEWEHRDLDTIPDDIRADLAAKQPLVLSFKPLTKD